MIEKQNSDRNHPTALPCCYRIHDAALMHVFVKDDHCDGYTTLEKITSASFASRIASASLPHQTNNQGK
jgi:hypothetical protein